MVRCDFVKTIKRNQIYHGVLRKGNLISVCLPYSEESCFKGDGLILVGRTFYFVHVTDSRHVVDECDSGFDFLEIGMMILQSNVKHLCVVDEDEDSLNVLDGVF